jgi:2-haloacid dehalogenase
MTANPAVILFDTFGTVVDWRGSIVAAGQSLSEQLGHAIDWGSFADEWRREGYLEPIILISTGQREWEPVDPLLDNQLDVLLDRHGLEAITEAGRCALRLVWRRLMPWPDAIEGLTRLKKSYLIGPLSNGSFAGLTEMAKAGGLPWDCVISTEFFRAFKPSPAAYLGAAHILGRSPGEVMLVAAHPVDLDAARAVGMQTGYVPRPLEWGPDTPPPQTGASVSRFDVIATDFLDLAGQLGT